MVAYLHIVADGNGELANVSHNNMVDVVPHSESRERFGDVLVLQESPYATVCILVREKM